MACLGGWLWFASCEGSGQDMRCSHEALRLTHAPASRRLTGEILELGYGQGFISWFSEMPESEGIQSSSPAV